MKKTKSAPKKLSRVGSNLQKKTPNPAPKKRDNIFSRSKDIPEDRATVQMKTTQNPMTNPQPNK